MLPVGIQDVVVRAMEQFCPAPFHRSPRPGPCLSPALRIDGSPSASSVGSEPPVPPLEVPR